MLGYTESDLNRMINAIHDSKLFYLRTPSDLMDKEPLRKDLEDAVSFLQGLWAEGYFDQVIKFYGVSKDTSNQFRTRFRTD